MPRALRHQQNSVQMETMETRDFAHCINSLLPSKHTQQGILLTLVFPEFSAQVFCPRGMLTSTPCQLHHSSCRRKDNESNSHRDSGNSMPQSMNATHTCPVSPSHLHFCTVKGISAINCAPNHFFFLQQLTEASILSLGKCQGCQPLPQLAKHSPLSPFVFFQNSCLATSGKTVCPHRGSIPTGNKKVLHSFPPKGHYCRCIQVILLLLTKYIS